MTGSFIDSVTTMWCKYDREDWIEVTIIPKKEEKAIVTYKSKKITINVPSELGLLTMEIHRADQKIFIDEKKQFILRFSNDQYDGAWIIFEIGKNEKDHICAIPPDQKITFLDESVNSSTEIWCKTKLKEWKKTRIITINEENVAKQTRKITIDSPSKFGLLTFEKRRTDQKIFIDDKNELILRYSEDQYGGTWIISELGRNENEMICGIQSHQKGKMIHIHCSMLERLYKKKDLFFSGISLHTLFYYHHVR